MIPGPISFFAHLEVDTVIGILLTEHDLPCATIDDHIARQNFEDGCEDLGFFLETVQRIDDNQLYQLVVVWYAQLL
jgi:hypothetical protein